MIYDEFVDFVRILVLSHFCLGCLRLHFSGSC